MRLLDTKSAALPLSELGFTAEELKKISVLISKPQGVILITGTNRQRKVLYTLWDYYPTEVRAPEHHYP